MEFIEVENMIITNKDCLLLVHKYNNQYLKVFFTSPFIKSATKDSKVIEFAKIYFDSMHLRDQAYQKLQNLVQTNA